MTYWNGDDRNKRLRNIDWKLERCYPLTWRERAIAVLGVAITWLIVAIVILGVGVPLLRMVGR